MEMNQSDVSNEEPPAKRPKIESQHSTSSKPKSKDPFLSLPSDVLVKIILEIPVAQWASLESLDNNFRDAASIAWRQLRSVDVERDFSMKRKNARRRWTIGKSVKSLLQKLDECSPFLTSLSGIDIQSANAELNSAAVQLLAQFEHLQSFTLGNSKPFVNKQGTTPLKNVVDFLESTRSRTTLNELHMYNLEEPWEDRAAILDRLVSSFVNGRENLAPLKLEKFALSSLDESLFIRLDNLDTTRLADLRVGKISIEPQQLTNLIERASNLLRIELSFLSCGGQCNGQRLEANKKLLVALASHENLTAIKFDWLGYNSDRNCTNFGHEFIGMLKTIGRRGRLRELALEKYFLPSSNIDMNAVCATIRDHIPYLRSIKLHIEGLSTESVNNISSLPELVEINFTSLYTPVTAEAVRKIAQLQGLKRLALHALNDEAKKSLGCLGDATTLTDLRIRDAFLINKVSEKWRNGFASNLEILILGSMVGRHRKDKYFNSQKLCRVLEKTVRLRVLILRGRITDELLWTIANSCPELELLCVESTRKNEEISVEYLQEIVDWCPKLKRLGGFGWEIRNELQFPKYRKIGDVDSGVWEYDFHDLDYY